MKRILIFTTLTWIFILSGCETDNLINENKNLVSKLNEANKQIQDFTKHKEDVAQLNDELKNIKKQLEKTINEQKQLDNNLNWYKSLITDIMKIKDFQFEIISQKINREPHDKVVYIKNVSDVSKDQLLYLLKAALTFSDDDVQKVTFWRDRNKAILYRDGKYDPEEGPSGWSGYDYRFGSIINNGQHSLLTQYNSRDDSQLIDFGKYTSRVE
jgi:predicted nuclease with TOPRIM domain